MDRIKLQYRNDRKQFTIITLTRHGAYYAFFDTYETAIFYIQKLQPCTVFLDASLTDRSVYVRSITELGSIGIEIVRD